MRLALCGSARKGWALRPLGIGWAATADGRKLNGYTRSGLIPVLEVFDLPAPYRPFNPVFQGQLSGDDFTNSSTRQEPTPDVPKSPA